MENGNLAAVIGAVKDDYNLDISNEDLTKFIAQLESMGFVTDGVSAPKAEDSDTVMDAVPIDATLPDPAQDDAPTVTTVAPTEDISGGEQTVEMQPGAGDLLDMGAATPDAKETETHLTNAFRHIKQGNLDHARDFLVAAKEADPNDTRIAGLFSQLEILGDSDQAANVEFLWGQIRKDFPDLAIEIGGFDAEMEQSHDPIPADPPVAEPSELDPIDYGAPSGSKGLLWVAAVLVLVGAAALGWFATTLSRNVDVVALQASKAPVFFEGTAKSSGPVVVDSPSFDKKTTIASIDCKVGQAVAAGDLLASAALPARQAKQLAKLRAARDKAKADHEAAKAALQKALSAGEPLVAERNQINAKLKGLKPKGIVNKAQRAELSALRAKKVELNKKLKALAKKERKPKNQERAAKKKLVAAQAKLGKVEEKLGAKILRAKAAGVVSELHAKVGDEVDVGKPVVTIKRPQVVVLEFPKPSKDVPQVGAQVDVFYGGSVQKGKVRDVEKSLRVVVEDSSDRLSGAKPPQIRLVKTFVEKAFRVPQGAVVANSKIFLVEEGKVKPEAVRVLVRESGSVVFESDAPAVKSGAKLVINVSKGTVGDLKPGAEVTHQ